MDVALDFRGGAKLFQIECPQHQLSAESATSFYCGICERSFKLSTLGSRSKLVQHICTVRHSDNLQAKTSGSDLGGDDDGFDKIDYVEGGAKKLGEPKPANNGKKAQASPEGQKVDVAKACLIKDPSRSEINILASSRAVSISVNKGADIVIERGL